MPADERVHRELGALSAEMASLKDQLSEFRQDLRDTRDAINQAKGGWKVVATLAGVAGGVAGFVVSVFKLKVGSS